MDRLRTNNPTVSSGVSIKQELCSKKEPKHFKDQALLCGFQEGQLLRLESDAEQKESKTEIPIGLRSIKIDQPVSPLYYEIISGLAKQQEIKMQIDSISMQNMAQALKFIGIQSLSQANEMQLEIIPPAPVFHTWYAKFGTTIFDGENLPQHLAHKKLNYIERISKKATALEVWNIPLFIVYSTENLTSEQIEKMESVFIDHNNIVILSIELDLKGKLSTTEEERVNIKWDKLDGIRCRVIVDYPKVISEAIEKSKRQGKLKLSLLLKENSHAICYSDIDNHWVGKPPFLLARKGMCSAPRINVSVSLLHAYYDYYSTYRKHLSKDQSEQLDQHSAYFCKLPFEIRKPISSQEMFFTQEDRDSIYRYIVSGECKKNWEYLSKIISTIDGHDAEDVYCLANGDNSLLLLNSSSREIFLDAVKCRHTVIDFYRKLGSGFNEDEFYVEAHNLAAIQLLKHFVYGKDGSWKDC